MSQASQLVDVLKQTLRDRGMTYSMLARALAISESSVKRLFSQKRLTLDRLADICAQLDLEITDLLEMARSSEERITELSESQERSLVEDPRLLLVGLMALSHGRPEEIVATYRLTEAEVVKHLAQLDQLGIIDLLPGNRIKLRLSRNFSWRKGGPLQQFFEARVQREFFHSSFHGPGELRFVVHGALSEHSNALLRQRVQKLAEEFDALVEDDRRLDHKTLAGTTMLVAVRPWELGIFAELRRKEAVPEGPTSVSRRRSRR
jgi:DNA-binding Xre family transcriptional regulator